MMNSNFYGYKIECQADLEQAVEDQLEAHGLSNQQFDPSLTWGEMGDAVHEENPELSYFLGDANALWYELEG